MPHISYGSFAQNSFTLDLNSSVKGCKYARGCDLQSTTGVPYILLSIEHKRPFAVSYHTPMDCFEFVS